MAITHSRIKSDLLDFKLTLNTCEILDWRWFLILDCFLSRTLAPWVTYTNIIATKVDTGHNFHNDASWMLLMFGFLHVLVGSVFAGGEEPYGREAQQRWQASHNRVPRRGDTGRSGLSHSAPIQAWR